MLFPWETIGSSATHQAREVSLRAIYLTLLARFKEGPKDDLEQAYGLNRRCGASLMGLTRVLAETYGDAMSVLVAYASKHGSTQGIAERVAKTLTSAGQEAEAWPAEAVDDLSGFEAFVVGSAVYVTHWRKEASGFVRRNRAILSSKPVWLFSSGPLGTEAVDAKGRELIVTAEPKEIAEFRKAIGPRDHRVFFGALDPSKLGLTIRLMRKLPPARANLPEGDFRDWSGIDDWANGIARHLSGSNTSIE